MLDKKAFMVIMAAFSDIAGRSLKTGTLDLYYKALSKYSTGQFQTAAGQLLQSRTYRDVPTVAEFVRILDGDAISKANDAWAKTLECIRSGGVPADEVSARLINTLNLRDICAENIPFARRDFIEAYKSMAGKAEFDNTLRIDNAKIKALTDNIGG